jgi:DNA-binding NtrC family response regulator
LIYICEVEALIRAIEGKQPAPNIECLIDINLAVQALCGGTSMATIVREVSETLEQHLIQHMLILAQGNKSETARRLRINYKTLYRKLHKYAVSYPFEKPGVSDLGDV